MKKGFLFGLGILFAGVALAATLSIPVKNTGDSLTAAEFNEVSTALNSLDGNTCAANKVMKGFASSGSSASLTLDCVSTGGGGVTAKDCGSGSFFQTVDANGNFTCVAEGAGSSPWITSGHNITYTTGNVGIGVDPKTTLDVTGGRVLAKEFCFGGGIGVQSCTDGTCDTSTGLVAGTNNSTCVTQTSVDLLESILKGGGAGDNLGNHTATQDITIGSNIITRGGFTTGVGTLGINPLGITTSSSGVKVGFINTPCTQSIVGTLRLDDQNMGGAAYSLQVCMSQTVDGWGWYTIMDSNNGIPSGTGICDPDTGVCT